MSNTSADEMYDKEKCDSVVQHITMAIKYIGPTLYEDKTKSRLDWFNWHMMAAFDTLNASAHEEDGVMVLGMLESVAAHLVMAVAMATEKAVFITDEKAKLAKELVLKEEG